ncbi:MAG TPA: biotin/lipoyl-containing protein [Pseudonocardia sp.]|jgi:acetyl-CoA carboxylase biotin carboxyl carrier protein
MTEPVSYREVREILRTFHDSGWTAMTLELGDLRIVIGKDGPPTTAAAPAAAAAVAPVAAPAAVAPTATPAASAPAMATATATPSAAPRSTAAQPSTAEPSTAARSSAGGGGGSTPSEVDRTEGWVAVRSPAVGAFWVAPGPGQPPFVEVGQAVAEDQQLGIVEVMKLMNPVLAGTAGQVVRVCAANAELVEYEQVLFWIRPA